MKTLYDAAEAGDLNLVREILRCGSGINDRDGEGSTALLLAAYRGRVPVVSFLLEGGADVNAPNNRGYTPLMAAAREGRRDTVDLLIDSGAEVNSADTDGLTALIWAAGYCSDSRVLEDLIRSGASVDAQDANGMTALIWAASMGLSDNVRVLLENGADPALTSQDGRSALSEARRRKRNGVIGLLEGWGVAR
jgi:ankyrin repeat protein